MIKLTFLLAFFLISTVNSAQKTDFLPVELIMENNDVRIGFLRNILDANPWEQRFSFKRIEKMSNISGEFLKFKKSLYDASEDVATEAVKSIIYKNGNDSFRFDKLKVKTLDSNLAEEVIGDHIFLENVIDNNLSLYLIAQSIFITTNGNSQYAHSLVIPYYKKKTDDYASNMIDYSKINIFSIGKAKDRIRKIYGLLIEDCPEMKSSTEKFITKITSNSELRKNRVAQNEKYKEIKKSIKNKRERLAAKMDSDISFLSQFHIEYVTEFNQKCFR